MSLGDTDSVIVVTRLRPTPRLGGFIMILTLLWITSANYNNNLGFILTYLLTAIGLLSPIHTRRQLSGVKVRLDNPQPVFAGKTAYLSLRLENTSRHPKHQLRLRVPGGEWIELSLEPEQTQQVSVPLEVKVRGRWPVQPVLIDSSFPLGLFRAFRKIQGDTKVWVYPRPGDNPPSFPKTSSSAAEGEHNFQGFRDYRPGDSIRQVHWKGLAKGLGLQSKHFREDLLDNDDLILDWEHLPAGNTEHRLEWLCRWLLDAEKSGRRYGLRLPFQSLAPASGPPHLHTCLRSLAEFPRD